MNQETHPPLRIREEDSSPNAIPVYEIVVSNGTLTQDGPGRVRLATGAGGAGVVYAATANQYVTLALAADLTQERVLSASSGLTQVDGGANGNVFLSVNTNVRDKVLGFFAAGTLTTVMQAASARIYAPFNMEVRDLRLACVTTPVGANIIVQLYQLSNPVAAGSAFFSSANRPIIATGGAIGSASTFANTVLFAGSYLGFSIDQIGTTSTGESMTITVVLRTS